LLYPLIILTIFFGIYPTPIFQTIAASVSSLLAHHDAALASAATSLLP